MGYPWRLIWREGFVMVFVGVLALSDFTRLDDRVGMGQAPFLWPLAHPLQDPSQWHVWRAIRNSPGVDEGRWLWNASRWSLANTLLNNIQYRCHQGRVQSKHRVCCGAKILACLINCVLQYSIWSTPFEYSYVAHALSLHSMLVESCILSVSFSLFGTIQDHSATYHMDCPCTCSDPPPTDRRILWSFVFFSIKTNDYSSCFTTPFLS